MTTTNSTEITIRGRSAIAYAKAHGLDTVEKSADPTEGARTVTIDEAEQIAREDPTLVYVTTSLHDAARMLASEVSARWPSLDHGDGALYTMARNALSSGHYIDAERVASIAREAETDAAAIGIGDEVEAGERGTEDHDTGRVLDVDGDTGKALVGWTAGVRTWAPLADLRRV